MNTLSWLIYAADALNGLKSAAGAVAVISIVAGVLVAIFYGVASADAPHDEDAERWASSAWRALRGIGVSLAIAGLVWIAAPSSRTIYLIAASEAGETIATSPDAIEMMGDLKAIIKKRLKDELGE